jgi:hypothetical protein
MRCRLKSLIMIGFAACLLLSRMPSLAQAQASSQPEKIDFDGLDGPVREQLELLLKSPDWPIRVFALLRLERYRGDEVTGFIRSALSDEAWQVRCFAIRQAHRASIKISEEQFAQESDPRVIRAAMRHGIKLPHAQVETITTRLLRIKGVDELMLGLEIAAACDNPVIRADAAKRAARIIQNMDDSIAALISRRLALLLNAVPAPETAAQWQQWLRLHRDRLELSRAGDSTSPAAARPIIADLDDEAFTRLLDYLGGLRQRDLDLVIVMDATSSMIPMINQARAGVDAMILFLGDISRQMRLAFVAYRDRDNLPVWDGHPFTGDVASIRNYLFSLRITGGADLPEAVLDGMNACAELEWNKKAERQIVLVGDAPPHAEEIYRVRALVESYRDSGITTHAVHVPMVHQEEYLRSLTPERVVQEQEELKAYNTTTSATFAEIAAAGGGKKAEMTEAQQLVPQIMHFTLEEAWWPVFDEFYDIYVQLCR